MALMEDVNESGRVKRPKSDPGIIAVKDFAHRAGMPFYGRRIASDFSWIVVTALNRFARGREPKRGFGERLSEAEYIVWRWSLGGRTITEKEAEEIVRHSINMGLDKPEVRSIVLSNLDDSDAIDRDLQKLEAIDLMKLAAAINRKLDSK